MKKFLLLSCLLMTPACHSAIANAGESDLTKVKSYNDSVNFAFQKSDVIDLSIKLPQIGDVIGQMNFPFAETIEAVKQYGPDKGLTRGIREAQLFRNFSPSVVMIVTKDGLGSGAIINENGLIVTNYHVVSGFNNVGVFFKPTGDSAKLSEQDMIPAQVVRFDQIKDLALISVRAVPAGTKSLKLGQLSDVSIGDDVHAIGHPKGAVWTYTKGVVSQIRTSFPWSGEDHLSHLATVLQTQTPINPGNSGGPLLNDDGNLVGINSFKNGDAENLAFAVSVDDVREFVNGRSNVYAKNNNNSPSKQTQICDKAKVVYNGPNTEKSGNLLVLDSTCSGRNDVGILTPYQSDKPEIMWFGPESFQTPTLAYFDPKRRDSWEMSFSRKVASGSWDTVCYYKDGDISRPINCQPY